MRRLLLVGAVALFSLLAAVGLAASASEPVPDECYALDALPTPQPVPSGRFTLEHDTGRIINGQLYFCQLGGPATEGQPAP